MDSLFGAAPAHAIPHDWESAACLDLINSRWSDHLGSGQSYDRLPLSVFRKAFLKRWGLVVDDPDDPDAVRDLARLRKTLRSALESYVAGRKLSATTRREIESVVNRASTTWEVVGSTSVELRAKWRGRDWDIAFAQIAASAIQLISERRRVKACANPHCSWMFVDESRPGTRRWCNVGVCGSLVNVRRFRAVAGVGPDALSGRRRRPRAPRVDARKPRARTPQTS